MMDTHHLRRLETVEPLDAVDESLGTHHGYVPSSPFGAEGRR